MRQNIELDKLPLLARGGQADIYDYGDGKVLRVPRREMDFDRIRYEYDVYVFLRHAGIAAPRVYDLVMIGKVPVMVMEKISGVSMMEMIRQNPFSITKRVKELVRLHHEVMAVTAADTITGEKDKAAYCINASEYLTDPIKRFLAGVLAGLPEANDLCHGDFHPGNIISVNGKYQVIDWSAASRGDFVSDIAHTYILMKVVPRVPGISPFMHALQRFLGNLMANAYLKRLRRLRPFTSDIFSRWVLIKAAQRSFYGLPSEKTRLVRFIERCFRAAGACKKTDDYYRYI
jgi:tRNA A-37 threonylcarbamoyl transferase component Bud32